ncbi:hypothetical protein J2X69_003308 [Algoriphagus sp. 4150]|uniref:hypothetical protein n=1 Tax=Algoriphagus sp. 4150 TaxID=2817756 RepID=UPI00285FB816|nr:hypothetical protein [Algoriphagus sp. 4150]MDR7130949.1 hypothetical protein [Algoriphagus sp. 4150]
MWIAINIEPETVNTELALIFQRKSNVITDHFNKWLRDKKISFSGVRKISISLTDVPGIAFLSGPIKGLDPVATVRKTYDFNKVSTLNDEDFYLEILKFIKECLTGLGLKLGWGLEVFEGIYDSIIDSKFSHVYYKISLKYSKSKIFKAGVRVEIIESGAQISMVFQKNEIDDFLVFPLIKTHPNKIFISQIVEKGKWLNDNEFLVTNTSGEINFLGKIKEKELKVFFTPKMKSEKQLIDEMLFMSVGTERDQIIKIAKDRFNNLGSII